MITGYRVSTKGTVRMPALMVIPLYSYDGHTVRMPALIRVEDLLMIMIPAFAFEEVERFVVVVGKTEAFEAKLPRGHNVITAAGYRVFTSHRSMGLA